MRFHLGPIPYSPEFDPDELSKSPKEPSLWLNQIIAIPIGAAASLLVALLWLVLILRQTEHGNWGARIRVPFCIVAFSVLFPLCRVKI